MKGPSPNTPIPKQSCNTVCFPYFQLRMRKQLQSLRLNSSLATEIKQTSKHQFPWVGKSNSRNARASQWLYFNKHLPPFSWTWGKGYKKARQMTLCEYSFHKSTHDGPVQERIQHSPPLVFILLLFIFALIMHILFTQKVQRTGSRGLTWLMKNQAGVAFLVHELPKTRT